MRSDIEHYVKACNQCQTNKALRKCNRAPMQITTTSTSPFQRVALDIVGPLPESGTAKLKYIMTLQDDLTKFSVAYPIRTVSAEETTDCLVHFISLFGIPKTILTDQGTNFTAELFKKTCAFLKIKQLWSSPYHPQTQGALERSHSTLKEYLKSYVNNNQDNWPKYLVQPISSGSGVYFDYLGNLRIRNNHLNVILPIDISHIKPHLENINSALGTLRYLCQQFRNKLASYMKDNILITKSVISNYNKTLHKIQLNEATLLEAIDKLSINFNNFIDKFTKVMNNVSPSRLQNIDLDKMNLENDRLSKVLRNIDKLTEEPHIIRYGTHYSILTICIIIFVLGYLAQFIAIHPSGSPASAVHPQALILPGDFFRPVYLLKQNFVIYPVKSFAKVSVATVNLFIVIDFFK
ncbi:hypothetical protein ABMA27_010507 [Loxostege sticticalis]|uniref:Integrase catalytic domain-containing protein n=1 Tax=Loxostege sticticalis TaxID=481309 RepID=A0ABR3H5W2_LOXSC